ncbi:glycogen debranching enzyme GlgX, partial [Pseudomonas protegens]|nr:glycogen debranching enzyme GlgX [Pseudomonas protegens]
SYNEDIGVKDVTWLAPDGSEMTTEHWQDPHGRCLGMLLDGRAQETGIRRPGADATLLLVVNAHHDIVNFRLPEVPAGEFWTCMLDTNQPAVRGQERFAFGHEYSVTGRSLLLFELQHEEED